MSTPRFHDGLKLVATGSAISCSRLFVAYTLDKWGAGFVINDAVLVVDELVTNAVKATGVLDERVRWTELTRIEFITVRLLGFDTSIRAAAAGTPVVVAVYPHSRRTTPSPLAKSLGGQVIGSQPRPQRRRPGTTCPRRNLDE